MVVEREGEMDKLGPLANLEESYYQMILIPLGGLTVI